MSKKRVTLAAIAKETGYSLMTVSYAMRNNLRIKKETREIIKVAANKMGYSPDPEMVKLMNRVRDNQKIEFRCAVSFLRNANTKEDWDQQPYTKAIAEGANKRLEQLGYSLDSFKVFEHDYSKERVSQIFKHRNIGGIMIPPMSTQEFEQLDLDWTMGSFISFDEKFNNPNFSRIIPHHHANMIILMKELWAKGYRKPGLLLTNQMLERDNYAWTGALRSFLQDVHQQEVIPPFISPHRQTDDFKSWLETYEPDCFIHTDTWLDDWLIEEMDMKLPSATVAADFSHLSGIDQQPEVIGACGADILNSLILSDVIGPPQNPTTTMITGKWADRGTL